MDRIMISGVSSGCGKTTVVCAVLQALVNRGLKTGAFKCGPDYIDPMFHSRIIGAKSANLDLHFFSENTLRFLLAKNAAGCDVSVIEGAMGFYDGAGLTTWKTSAYELALVTKTPVVLVVNARGAALSVLAVIEGFLRFRPESGIRGVILNQCTAMTYASLSDAIEERFGIRCFGFLPRLDECVLESRHLGLVTAGEIRDLREKMQTLAAQAEKTLDIDALLALAHEAEPLDYTPVVLPKKEKIRLAVARDNAFCFYYEDSLNLLRRLGANLIDFSPLHDNALPEDLDGLYLGGGYPELYAQALSGNETMRQSIREAVCAGLPCIAECGGFMYLTEAIGGCPMAGVLPGSCFDTGKLTRFGYVTLTASKDNLLCRAGQSIPAHEFHHWDAEQPGSDFTAEKPSCRRWTCAVATDTLYAGFPHFHFYANPTFAVRFLDACRKESFRHAGAAETHGH